MTASVTVGRALRYADGSARGLLHHHPGRDLSRLIIWLDMLGGVKYADSLFRLFGGMSKAYNAPTM
jgi:hypothetical protein